jgi:cytochrome c-type biogenesis protein CcmH
VFWTFAAALLFAAALITFFPLLRAKTIWKPLSLALVFLVPAAASWMYTHVGTPEGVRVVGKPPAPQAAQNPGPEQAHSPESREMDAMIAGLQARLEQNPEDLDGLMLLARSYKATQRFAEAAAALEKANQLEPGNPVIMVDLVETEIFLTPNGRISDENVATLKQAVEIDPGMQKALWLLGIASSQRGDANAAIGYWETLLAQLEPGSTVAQSVQNQIDQLKAEPGMAAGEPEMAAATAPEPEPVDEGSWQGVNVSVRAGNEARSRIPTGGVLYVMIRSSGPAMGPPLGVRRIIDAGLPLELTISDGDSMMKERMISSEANLQLQARISLTGSPAANTGDWQSAPMSVSLDSNESVELVIDQRVE